VARLRGGWLSIRGHSQQGRLINLCPKCPDCPWNSHSTPFKGYKGIFPRHKAVGERKLPRHIHLVSKLWLLHLSLHFTLACIACSTHNDVFIFVWVAKKLSAFLLFCFDVHMHLTADTKSVSHGEYVICYSADHNYYNKNLKFRMCFYALFTYVGVTETRAIDLSKPTLATTNLSSIRNTTFTSIIYWLITLNFLFDK